MLLTRFDLPFYAPQVLAFMVRRHELGVLRGAFTDLYTRADGAALTALWERTGAALEERKRTSRWIVPRASLERTCEKAVSMSAPFPEARERIVDAVVRMRLAARGEELDVPADRWSTLEHAFGVMRFGSESWANIFAGTLEELFTPREPAPVAGFDLSFVETATRTPDGVHLQHENEVVDLSFFGEAVRNRAHIDDFVHALVGPFEQSRGPGPFLPRPSAAQPIVDPRAMLPLFDRAPDVHVLADAPSLLAALDEVRSARAPVKPWDGDEDLYEYAPTDPPWNTPWSVIQKRWEPFRDRFAALLAEAYETERAVVFVDADVTDQGPGGIIPIDATWGHVRSR